MVRTLENFEITLGRKLFRGLQCFNDIIILMKAVFSRYIEMNDLHCSKSRVGGFHFRNLNCIHVPQKSGRYYTLVNGAVVLPAPRCT
jgi:hypothetical protein